MCIRRVIMQMLLVSLVAATSAADQPPVTSLDRLVHYMTGSFSSQEQSASDSNYHDIRLTMTRIWASRIDACWLYVEQATASSLDKPYRQRVYRVRQVDDTTFESAVFVIAEPLRFAGAGSDTLRLAALTPDSLEERIGCSIILHPEGDTAFAGSTVDHDCPSSLAGATYATSEVRITGTEMYSWDRGFDADGNQVWGATDGGYRFRKILLSD